MSTRNAYEHVIALLHQVEPLTTNVLQVRIANGRSPRSCRAGGAGRAGCRSGRAGCRSSRLRVRRRRGDRTNRWRPSAVERIASSKP
eukprot:9494612-Pyramimonas_sp.AAC.1